MTKTYKVRYKKTLPKRIQYAGSTIQQNFGESLEKGYLLWDIHGPDDFDTQFHRVMNDYGFFTLHAADGKLPTVDLPPKCRVRVVWPIAERDISRSLVNELTALVREKYNPLSVRIDFKPMKDSRGRELELDEILDVREFSVQQDLLKRWLNQHTLPEEMISEILGIDRLVYEKANTLEFEDFSQSMWKINSITIKNFMSYKGPDTIDFRKMKGTIGLFGDNRSGKSVIIDAILYALFNKTTRNVKNTDLINKVTSAKACSVELNITIRGVEYRIKRESKKQFKKRTGEYHWTRTDLELSRVFEDGTEEDLTETQRNETEKIIRNAIGSYDDFLTTTLTIQSSQHEFIFQNPAVRSENMARFLGLDIFNRKYDIAKDIMREVDAARKMQDIDEKTHLLGQLRHDISRLMKQLNTKESRLSEINAELRTNNDSVGELMSSLNTKINIDQTREEIDVRVGEVKKLLSDIDADLVLKAETAKDKLRSAKSLENDLITETSKLLELSGQYADLLDASRHVDSLISTEKAILKSLRDQLQSQTACPVGEYNVTAGCVFLQQAKSTRDLVKDHLDNVEDLAQKSVKLQNKTELAADANSKMQQNAATRENIQRLIAASETLRTELANLRGQHEIKTMSLSMLEDKLALLDKNEEIVQKNRSIQNQIEKLKENTNRIQKERDTLHSEVTDVSKNLAVAQDRLQEIERIISEISSNDHMYELYNWYTKAMHRNGIPVTVLRKYVPVINYELNAILSSIVGYGVYFKIDDDSDNIEIVMRYDDNIDDTRPITMASGMEKFISNMAIRHVLLKISCLNKPTLRIIDEGFDVLDNDNIYLVQKFFENVKGEFDNIVIITHIDALKDCADHIINVSQSNGVSKLQLN